MFLVIFTYVWWILLYCSSQVIWRFSGCWNSEVTKMWIAYSSPVLDSIYQAHKNSDFYALSSGNSHSEKVRRPLAWGNWIEADSTL